VAQGADVVSHEATFDGNMYDKAQIAQHSTASMAGAFGRRIGARHLFLTHFSSRYSKAVMPSRYGNKPPPTSQVICFSQSLACQSLRVIWLFRVILGKSAMEDNPTHVTNLCSHHPKVGSRFLPAKIDLETWAGTDRQTDRQTGSSCTANQMVTAPKVTRER